MQRFKEASETKEKYKDELMHLGATSVHVNLRKHAPHGKTESYRIFIIIKVYDQNRKTAIEGFLATQKHPGRLGRFRAEVVITKKKPGRARLNIQIK